MNKQDFDADAFYEALDREVRTRDTTWRQVSSETGVNATDKMTSSFLSVAPTGR